MAIANNYGYSKARNIHSISIPIELRDRRVLGLTPNAQYNIGVRRTTRICFRSVSIDSEYEHLITFTYTS